MTPKADWTADIEQLEQYFSSIELPESLELAPFATITDLQRFVKAHLSTVRRQNGKRVFLPYLERLVRVAELLKKMDS
ncbi:MAG: hypothetical protein AAF960_23395 [Bacteroidota bacterium]